MNKRKEYYYIFCGWKDFPEKLVFEDTGRQLVQGWPYSQKINKESKIGIAIKKLLIKNEKN
jgi:hypothetical protein